MNRGWGRRGCSGRGRERRLGGWSRGPLIQEEAGGVGGVRVLGSQSLQTLCRFPSGANVTGQWQGDGEEGKELRFILELEPIRHAGRMHPRRRIKERNQRKLPVHGVTKSQARLSTHTHKLHPWGAWCHLLSDFQSQCPGLSRRCQGKVSWTGQLPCWDFRGPSSPPGFALLLVSLAPCRKDVSAEPESPPAEDLGNLWTTYWNLFTELPGHLNYGGKRPTRMFSWTMCRGVPRSECGVSFGWGWPLAHTSLFSAVQMSWHLWEVGLGRNGTHCIPGKMLVGGPSRRWTDSQRDFTEL